MTEEGYIQLKIRDLRQEVQNLDNDINNLKNEIKIIENINENTKFNIKKLEEIKTEILSMNLNSFQDKIVNNIQNILNIKINELREYESKHIILTNKKILDYISNRMDNELWPELNKRALEIAEHDSNLIVNQMNLMIDNFNSNTNLKIPHIDYGKITTDEDKMKLWAKRHSKVILREDGKIIG